MLKYLVLLPIRFYQLCLAPFIPKCCRFYPSCSNYAQEAIEVHGVWRGGYLMVKRLLKCGPWHQGGIDCVPMAESTSSQDEASLAPEDLPVAID